MIPEALAHISPAQVAGLAFLVFGAALVVLIVAAVILGCSRRFIDDEKGRDGRSIH